MLKKLLHLYNDGHNPFPHMKGGMVGGVEEHKGSDEEEDYHAAYKPDDDNNDYDFVLEIPFEYEDPRETFGPNASGEKFEEYKEKYEDYISKMEEETGLELRNNYYDEDEEERNVLGEINKITNLSKAQLLKKLGDKTLDEIKGDMDKLELMEKEVKKNNIKNNLEAIKIKQKIVQDCKQIELETFRELTNKNVKRAKVITTTMQKISADVMHIMTTEEFAFNEKVEQVNKEINKIMQLTKIDDKKSMYILYSFLNDVKNETTNKLTGVLINAVMELLLRMPQFKDYYSLIEHCDDTTVKNKKMLNEIAEQKKKLDFKIKYIEVTKEEIKESMEKYNKSKEYFDKRRIERNKILDHKKRLSDIKRLQEIDPEQALKDAQELNAELKEKEALAQSKQLSKSAQKKAKAAEKKALAEKQAEAPVVNAQAALKSTGTYGKKLETFFTGGGQPILQKFTGDKSKIHDIEKQEIIPDEIVTFDDKTTNSLRKACTLDLYNDKFVFEIKNYLNISFYDDKVAIPMQPSKFAGTKYFTPTYLEDGSLYKLNLKYDSPITGIQHRQNILPDTSYGRELIFIIRLKEGLYYYRPFKDTENNTLIPNGEFASGKRPLYFFESTKLKKCKDFKGNPAFNLRGHLTPI